ncbi:hypothetical protein TTHERM_000461821 (macronuclear) [Tetrahymena thermophila SB210]|uniref:Kinase domain protein n=1 Tax=Tetrahymena thermophila (strain SB210) TaxID=312017 RepID=W7XH83_TETTS|nr:hypothetical protein TTHERM_000461821 [Tetrahymena thermophila SB210]EWS73696.1 hypothetical protein TTHERM_000461821 [Tetrahymena thermophila SB210]|eukprot:XP_012653734.1 hypothetical protein TTHERM_000461821 [Tetrahymena thermophila SB210]
MNCQQNINQGQSQEENNGVDCQLNQLPTSLRVEQSNQQENENQRFDAFEEFGVNKKIFSQIIKEQMNLDVCYEDIEKLESLSLNIDKIDYVNQYIYTFKVANTLSYLKSLKLIINLTTSFPQEFISKLNKQISFLYQISNLDVQLNIQKNTVIQEYLDQFSLAISNSMNLQSLNFSVESQGSNIEPLNLTSFLKCLNKLQNLSSLSLIFRNFAKFQNQIKIFGREFKEIKNLKNLKLYFYPPQDKLDLALMFQQLEVQNKLVQLSLGFEFGNIESKGIEVIMTYLQKLPCLRHLAIQIRDCRLGYQGGQAFKDGFQSLQNLEKLSLTLKNSYMGEKGYQLVSEGFSYLLKLKQLEIITEDNIGSDYYEYLTSTIPKLKHLLIVRFAFHCYLQKKVFQRSMRSIRLVSIYKN